MLQFNKNQCFGCRICEIICSISHHKEINTKLAKIRYTDDWPFIGNMNFCRQCKKRSCVSSCPEEGALFINNADLVELRPDKCSGCMRCSEACPFGSLPSMGALPLYCDTCFGEYSCAKWCPSKALKVGGK